MPKRRTQVKRAWGRANPYYDINTSSRKLPHKKTKKKPKTHILTNKQKLHLAMEKAGLARTRVERRRAHAELEGIVGHKIQRLSDVVNKPSRHTVKGTRLKYEVVQEAISGHYNYDTLQGKTIWVPAQPAVKRVKETLIAKRLRKRQGKKSGSKRGEGVVVKEKPVNKPKHKRARSKGGRAVKEARTAKSKKKK